MNSWKDLKNRRNYNKIKKRIVIYKYFVSNETYKKSFRFKAMLKLQKITNIISISKLKNRCVLNNKSRANYRIVNLSKIPFKSLLTDGRLNGFRKASW